MDLSLKYFRFNTILLSDRWLRPAYVGVDPKGEIQYLSDASPADASIEVVNGYALPGFQNAHSHAFQYAMAGLAEIHGATNHDDFWTWRELMYRYALSLNPDQAEAIASMLYAEMIRHGYTQVAEFHYLHHDKHGKPYQHVAEMGERMIAAAEKAGIKITLIPVFYQRGGFGQPAEAHQRRFISESVDAFLRLLDESAGMISAHNHVNLGFSIHSLRAVDAAAIVKTFTQGPKEIPFHLHIAEQKKEVEDCLSFLKMRPVEWLFENLPVNERFNLVHATHLGDNEVKAIASSRAKVILCPSTEGNLGDGFFRMKDYSHLKGKWCIGTDSHVGLHPLEEMRMIDYHQRLITNTRNPLSNDAAHYMLDSIIENGRSAVGNNSTRYFGIGQAMDAVVFDDVPSLSVQDEGLLSKIVFTGHAGMIKGTLVNGSWIFKNNRHVNGEEISRQYRKALKEISLEKQY